MEAIELEAAAEYLNVSPHVSRKQLISEMENAGREWAGFVARRAPLACPH